MKKTIIAILMIVFLGGCGITPELPNEIMYRAFLVGIEDCIIDSMDLPVAGYNVERLKEIFSACKFTEKGIEFLLVDTLRGNNSTKEAILRGISSIFGKADKNDISYFYFMGHGGMRNEHPILCPTDYNGQIESTIKLEELEIVFDTIQGTKILFLESCHSGNFIEKDYKEFNDKVISVFNTKAFNKENYQVLTSSKGNQRTWYYGNMSFFAMGLYTGCQDLSADSDGDGIINLTELHIYIDKWVHNHTNQRQDAQIYPKGSIFPIIEH